MVAINRMAKDVNVDLYPLDHQLDITRANYGGDLDIRE